MLILGIGLILFLGMHSVSIVAPHWREAAVQRLGLVPWQGLYALVAILGFVLIIQGYAVAREAPVLLYAPPDWLRHVALLLLLPVFPLLLATYLPGRIQTIARHPMLLATKLWAVAHLLANGTLADVLLFGGFLAWAVADRVSLRRRQPVAVPGAPPTAINDWLVVLVGLGLYVGFVAGGHAWLIGVAPVP